MADGRVWVAVDTPSLASRSRGGPNGGTLRIVSAYDVDYTDPALAYDTLSEQLLYTTCAKLLNYPDRAAAARLAGPWRYLTYGALDLDPARNTAPLNTAPLAALGNGGQPIFSASSTMIPSGPRI